MNIVIPMAGNGSRFPKDQYPYKPLIPIRGETMISRVLNSLDIEGNYYFVIRKDNNTNAIKNLVKGIIKSCNFIEIDYTTQGPACSVLLFEDQLDLDSELIVANCDQIMEWNSRSFLLNARQYDGCVVTYHSDTDKNSYIKIDKHGLGVELREKIVISNISLNGIHYWRQAKLFIKSAKDMITMNDRASNGEFYISQSYNYMIKDGLKVGIYHIPNQQHHAVGTPEDLDSYLKNYDRT